MKALIVFTHPDLNSFNHLMKDQVKKTLVDKNYEVTLRDLYRLPSESFFESKNVEFLQSERAKVEASDVIVFIQPLWWSYFPSITKNYIETVFSKGFAYQVNSQGIEGLLKNKKVAVFFTASDTEQQLHSKDIPHSISVLLEQGMFNYFGVELSLFKIYGNINDTSNDVLKHILTDVEYEIKKII